MQNELITESKELKPKNRLKNLKINLIIEIAEKYFSQLGYEKAQVTSIAQDSGVSVGTIYNLFGSKEELFMEYLSKKISLALQQNSNAILKENEPTKKLKKYIEVKFKYIHNNEFIIRENLLYSPFFCKKIVQKNQASYKKLIGLIQKSIEDIITDNNINPISDDTRQLAYNFISLTDSYISRWLYDDVKLEASKSDYIVKMFINSIKDVPFES